MIKILIVDDHEAVREGLRLLLDEGTGVLIVGEAGSGEEALELAQLLEPDVILMDLVLPGIDGLETTRRLRASGLSSKVLVLTSFANDRHVDAALEAGAVGYLLKDILKEELLLAIRSVRHGKPVFYLGAQT